MKAKEFLLEFDDSAFPRDYGPWFTRDSHDPPFTKAELRQMARAGMIQLTADETRYRLTLEATAERERIALEGVDKAKNHVL